jgi:L-alanine-DL-glutamate epimerase-like enolase superfamily enzyme
LRIDRIETRRYVLPLDPPFHAAWDPEPRTRFAETVVIVHTDAGIRGFAGGSAVPDLDLLSSLLVGVDAHGTAEIFEMLQTVDFHGGRNWTVEVAVHDAVARAREQPLFELLGGARLPFPAYASSGQRVGVEDRVERTLAWRDRGIRALKLRFFHEEWTEDVAVVEAVRHAVGDTMDIMVDANHGWRMPGDLSRPWDGTVARACADALADLDVYWLEEPLPTEEVDDYVELRKESVVRIAGGEMVRTLAETRRLIAAGAFDVVQNDVVLSGGLTGAARLSAWAERHGVVWSPHTWTTGLGLLANLHAALAFSTAAYIEVPYDPPQWSPERRDFMLPEALEIGADGTISVPEGPGLGVEPDFAALERWRVA